MADPFLTAYQTAHKTNVPRPQAPGPKWDPQKGQWVDNTDVNSPEWKKYQDDLATWQGNKNYADDYFDDKTSAAAAKSRRDIKGKDWKPDIFDTLANQWQEQELTRLGIGSTRNTLFRRPTGLKAPSTGVGA